MHKIKLYLILLAVLLLLGIAALIFVVNAFSPDESQNILLFYALLILTAFSAATLLGFYVRRLLGQREFLNSYATTASRQGLWLALILAISFLLLQKGLFSWINALLLIFTFIFFESYLLTRKNNNFDNNI